MTPYIPKFALVEKINNWIKDARRKYTMSKVQFSLGDRIKSLEKLLSFLDTLEVKEVDSNDAFIEKVINFLNYKLDDVVATRVPGKIIPHPVAKQEFIEDFKNYMKGK